MSIVITITGRDLCRLMNHLMFLPEHPARYLRAVSASLERHTCISGLSALSPTERAVAHVILVAQLTMDC